MADQTGAGGAGQGGGTAGSGAGQGSTPQTGSNTGQPSGGSGVSGGQRTGPSTGNAGGNDLPSTSSTQRDTRGAEGEATTPGRDAGESTDEENPSGQNPSNLFDEGKAPGPTGEEKGRAPFED